MRHEASPGQKTIPLLVAPQITRALEVQRLIDPNDSLPKLQIEYTPTEIPQEPPLHRQRWLVLHGPALIGQLTTLDHTHEGTRWVDYLQLDRNLPAQFETSVYATLISKAMIDGYAFRTHPHSENGHTKGIWEDLATRGVARIIENFIPVGEDSYRAHYLIDGPQAIAHGRPNHQPIG